MYSLGKGKFVRRLCSTGFYDVFNLQTWAIGWFVYLVAGCYSFPCRFGRHRRQPATKMYTEFLRDVPQRPLDFFILNLGQKLCTSVVVD